MLRLIFLWSIWDYKQAEKELFIIKFNKAWSQKIYRESKGDDAAINTYISKDSKQQLDELIRHFDKNLYEVLEMLIKSEHNKMVKLAPHSPVKPV